MLVLEAAERVAGSVSADEAPYWSTPDDMLTWVRGLRHDNPAPDPAR